MTEPNSKWDATACLKTCWLPAAAAVLALSPMQAVAGAASNDGGEASISAVGPIAGEVLSEPVYSSTSIRANLASVAASSFEPAQEGVVDLATFTAKPGSAMLNVPGPGSLAPAAPAKDHIPEPGAIGFGLAVAALIFGNFAKALMRCWKITGTTVDRER